MKKNKKTELNEISTLIQKNQTSLSTTVNDLLEDHIDRLGTYIFYLIVVVLGIEYACTRHYYPQDYNNKIDLFVDIINRNDSF